MKKVKKVLIDINVIMDVAVKREGFISSQKVINYCMKKMIAGYVCSHEITTLSYLLQRKYNRQKASVFIKKILDMFIVLPSTGEILKLALNSRIKDYEDAVIEVTGLKNDIDFIITRNIKDFNNSRIISLSPEEFLTKFNSGD